AMAVAAVLCAMATPVTQSVGAQGAVPAPRAVDIPRTAEGIPDFSGIWQALSGPEYDIEPHGGRIDAPPGRGIVDGDTIPYRADARARQQENFAARMTADPRAKCFTLGTP